MLNDLCLHGFVIANNSRKTQLCIILSFLASIFHTYSSFFFPHRYSSCLIVFPLVFHVSFLLLYLVYFSIIDLFLFMIIIILITLLSLVITVKAKIWNILIKFMKALIILTLLNIFSVVFSNSHCVFFFVKD